MKNQKFQKEKKLLLEDLWILGSQMEDLWQFLPISVCSINSVFNIVNASKTLEEISGYRGVEIIGENLKGFFKYFEEIKKELAEKETFTDRETTFFTKDKKEIIVNLSAKTRKDEKGEITGYFFAFTDITEIREKEKELQKKVQELEKLNKLAVGRELKMIELKKEVARLKKEIAAKR